MAHLPLNEKPLIQASYVRYRELVKEIPEADKKVILGQFAHWGGVAVAVAVFSANLIGKIRYPEFLGVIGLLSMAVGWLYKRDRLKEQEALWLEQSDIRKQMSKIGVTFVDADGRVTVFSGEVKDENWVSPLSDNSYR